MTIEVAVLISLSGLLIAAATFFTNFTRNSKKDAADAVEERASMNARVLTKLDGISDDLREIKKDNQDIRKDLSNLSDRVLILEQKQHTIDPVVFASGYGESHHG